jgi:hypothetical protein
MCFENVCNIVHFAHRQKNFRAAFSIQKVLYFVLSQFCLRRRHEEDKKIAKFTNEGTERPLEARKLDSLKE